MPTTIFLRVYEDETHNKFGLCIKKDGVTWEKRFNSYSNMAHEFMCMSNNPDKVSRAQGYQSTCPECKDLNARNVRDPLERCCPRCGRSFVEDIRQLYFDNARAEAAAKARDRQ